MPDRLGQDRSRERSRPATVPAARARLHRLHHAVTLPNASAAAQNAGDLEIVSARVRADEVDGIRDGVGGVEPVIQPIESGAEERPFVPRAIGQSSFGDSCMSSLLERRDRRAGVAERAAAAGIVRRRGVFDERDDGRAEIHDRLEPIADADDAEHGAASRAHEIRAAPPPSARCSAHRLPAARGGPSRAAGRTDAASAPCPSSVSNGANEHGGCVRLRRLSSSPAMVCASSAPPVAGPATTSVAVEMSSGTRSRRSCASRQIVDG